MGNGAALGGHPVAVFGHGREVGDGVEAAGAGARLVGVVWRWGRVVISRMCACAGRRSNRARTSATDRNEPADRSGG